MTLGKLSSQSNLFDDMSQFCEKTLPKNSIYAFLHRERNRLFPDDAFEDLFSLAGRRSVPPSVIATVMVLQRLEGCSDREAVDRFTFDARWRYGAGVGSYDTSMWPTFSHTVLVDFRERLRRSERPDRIFEAALQAANEAGLIGRKRVLDSTPLYDAVATMDTITLIRSSIRNLLRVADGTLRDSLLRAFSSGDDYLSSAKPQIDWDDKAARDALIDSRATDGYGALLVLEGSKLSEALTSAASLLATVLGQDLETGEDGTFRIARKVAKDRVISVVDPEARHGRKTSSRSFDGYKGHIALDPDSEIITATVVTAGNAGDQSVAEELIGDLCQENEVRDTSTKEPGCVYGDSAYGTGEFQFTLEAANIDSRCKTQPPRAKEGYFTKESFCIDLEGGTVTCPRGITTKIQGLGSDEGIARFGSNCLRCPLAAQCTTSKIGRTIRIGRHEAQLARARKDQRDPTWLDDYRATRPKVERKFSHLMRRRHGGRRARVRGLLRVGNDFSLLAGAINLARLATLEVHSNPSGQWQVVL